MKIGFVSRGNAIRGLFAEAVAKQLIKATGIKAEIYSAGIEPEAKPHEFTLRILKDRNYPTEGLRPKGISEIPYSKLDILVTIGEEAKNGCEFEPHHKRREAWIIEEPAGGIENFIKAYQAVEQNILTLFKL